MNDDLTPREKIDGFTVENYGGRISGSFDIDAADGRRIKLGDDVVMVLFAKVKDPVFKEDKAGDIRRVDVFKADEVWVCTDPDRRAAVLNALVVEAKDPNQSALEFDPPELPRPQPEAEAAHPEWPRPQPETEVSPPPTPAPTQRGETVAYPGSQSYEDQRGGAAQRDPVLAAFLSGGEGDPGW